MGERRTAAVLSTYAAADPADPATASLKARTRVTLAGDAEVYLSDDAADTAYLAVHEKTVAEAVRARIAYLDLVGRAKG